MVDSRTGMDIDPPGDPAPVAPLAQALIRRSVPVTRAIAGEGEREGRSRLKRRGCMVRSAAESAAMEQTPRVVAVRGRGVISLSDTISFQTPLSWKRAAVEQ